ncbi:hypothetical protein [Pseudonocardia sp. Ae717_Ps2]|nr:hypothetical protein [Pseudonocardia sp. Ae717_Ps2]
MSTTPAPEALLQALVADMDARIAAMPADRDTVAITTDQPASRRP